MRTRTHAALLCAVAAVLPTTAASAAQAGAERPDLRPGDVVRAGGVGAAVPGPGRLVSAEAFGVSDSSELTISTDRSGRVFVDTGNSVEAPTDAELSAAAASPGECSDTAYNHATVGGQKYRWTTTFGWYFHSSTTPGEISAGNALNDLQHATENMKWANNNCGRADNIGATSTYLGTTSADADINSDLTCGGASGKSVVGFGTYNSSSVLAAACTYATLNPGGTYATAVESDVKYNKGDFEWFTGSIPSGCSGRYSVEAVGTHERGHTFGLGHVSEESHGKLTMSTALNGPCQKSEATLGLGDMLGMEALY